ncbi:NADP-dependent oxidoreductase domain-containing protein [Mycena rebaudengoi]|nr:NADP-dependent oxidoreductase domain-containing protein [Mycena rebaudengoi]
MPIPTRRIGQALVPAIGFGAMGISSFYGAVDIGRLLIAALLTFFLATVFTVVSYVVLFDNEQVLDTAFAQGCTHFDTARIYGDSEVLIGKWLKRTGNRSKIFLATKFGVTPNGPRGDPEYVKEQIAVSFANLGVEQIDLADPKVPIEVTVGAMAELVKEGKVKYLGLSECSAKALKRAHAVHPISALQTEYSPFVLDIEDPKIALLETARELGVTIVAYSPLGRGLLTGVYKSPDDFEKDDFRRTIPKYSAENFPKILDVVSSLKEIGVKHNATAGQVTLAWILAQGPEFVVIPGTKKIKAGPFLSIPFSRVTYTSQYLEENAGAAAISLSKDEIAAVRKIAEESDIPGTRYNEAIMVTLRIDSPELPK